MQNQRCFKNIYCELNIIYRKICNLEDKRFRRAKYRIKVTRSREVLNFLNFYLKDAVLYMSNFNWKRH